MEDIVEVLGAERRVVLAREVTKIHEEFLRGTAEEVLGELKSRGEIKGEITLLLGKADQNAARDQTGQPARAGATTRPTIRQRMTEIMAEQPVDEKTALKKAAKERGISKSEAYRELQRSK
jgi:16S rRNA (cytidine1402-2'-O)-methyltransferase